MKKLLEGQVSKLVREFGLAVSDSPVDPGQNPQTYLREVFVSPEFYAFMRFLSEIPGAYEENIGDILRVLPDAFPLFVEMTLEDE